MSSIHLDSPCEIERTEAVARIVHRRQRASMRVREEEATYLPDDVQSERESGATAV